VATTLIIFRTFVKHSVRSQATLPTPEMSFNLVQTLEHLFLDVPREEHEGECFKKSRVFKKRDSRTDGVSAFRNIDHSQIN